MNINDLVKRYDIFLMEEWNGARFEPTGNLGIRNVKAVERDGALPEIKARKPELLAALLAEREAENKAVAERQAKIDGIEGLAEICAASAELEEWERAFQESFEGECGGFGVGPKPSHDMNSLLAKYPRAAAYLRAEREANKKNYELAAIGRDALERIINEPEGYADAIAKMEAAIRDFVDRHRWD